MDITAAINTLEAAALAAGITPLELARARAAVGTSVEYRRRVCRARGIKRYCDLPMGTQELYEEYEAVCIATAPLLDEAHGQGACVTMNREHRARVWALTRKAVA